MKTTTNARYAILFATLATILAACSDKPESIEPAATDPGPMPVGRLDTRVTPEHYRLELRVDPREDQFSGTTSIDLNIAEPVSHIWLHGKNLNVTVLQKGPHVVRTHAAETNTTHGDSVARRIGSKY